MPAYDTVLIKSPALEQEQKDKLLEFCDWIRRTSIGTGELKSTFTTGMLEGSYDYRIRITVDNREWVKPEGYNKPIQIESYWYVEFECSVHKLMNKHNVFGGPNDIKKSISYLIQYVEENTGVQLPSYLLWYPKRIDCAKIFVLHDENIVKRIIMNLKQGIYSRRKLHPCEGGGVYATGSTSTVKFYPKGPEFEEHDMKRFNRYIMAQMDLAAGKENRDLIWQKLALFKKEIEKVHERAKRTIRFETEIKIRTLKNICGTDNPTVEMLDDEKLFAFMESELRKCIKENEDMEIVRRSDLVEERLDKIYKSNTAKVLFSMWVLMVQHGEKYVKEKMKNQRATYFRHRKMLFDAGVSWAMSNINLSFMSIVPKDFTFLDDKYADNSVSKEVQRILEEVA